MASNVPPCVLDETLVKASESIDRLKCLEYGNTLEKCGLFHNAMVDEFGILLNHIEEMNDKYQLQWPGIKLKSVSDRDTMEVRYLGIQLVEDQEQLEKDLRKATLANAVELLLERIENIATVNQEIQEHLNQHKQSLEARLQWCRSLLSKANKEM